MEIFSDYPDAIVAFRLKLGDRYLDLVEWIHATPTGYRPMNTDLAYFESADDADAFALACPDRIRDRIVNQGDHHADLPRVTYIEPTFPSFWRRMMREHPAMKSTIVLPLGDS